MFAALAAFLQAQPDRLSSRIDGSRTITLAGNHDFRTQTAKELGPVDTSQQMEGLVLFFTRSATQQQSLDRLLVSQQDPSSPEYHQWLTPEQFADRFGISQNDAGRVRAWLESDGFHVAQIARSRSFMVFSGSAAQIANTFHTEIHRYRVGEETHFANNSDPSIPAALAGLASAITGLDDFYPQPATSTPHFTGTTGNHSLAPDDLATIYDIAPLYAAGIDGTGQKIAIAGASTIDIQDIQSFRSTYHLPAGVPQLVVVPNFANPGQTAALTEANLDIDAVSAVARNAQIIFVYTGNAYNAVTYAIDQNLAPVVNASFHMGCDTTTTAATKTTYQSLAQQANAQGITWINSSGDIGPAGCDNNGVAKATLGLSARFPASIPEVTAVGGTQLNDANGTYWSATNTANGASALSYIPEISWNDAGATIFASTGGVSSLFAKPSWQTGTGVPNDGHRDIPDVSFSASSHTPYRIVSGGSTLGADGSSASAPVMSGIVTLLNHYVVSNGIQKQPGLGNINPHIYQMARSVPSAFHDVTQGNNIVPCMIGSPDCTTGSFGYTAGPGFDLVTGWGSLDVNTFFQNWKLVAGSAVIVSSSANPVYQLAPDANGNSWTVTLTLTETAAIATTLTDFLIDGTSQLSVYFPNTAIAGNGVVKATVSLRDTVIPFTHKFVFNGTDASGFTWTREIDIPFVGFQPSSSGAVPTVSAAGNGASFQQIFAPGMIMTVFGTQFASVTQAAPGVPLPNLLQNFEATMNGVVMPLYFVSGQQVNAQIPYGTPPGPANLVVYNGGQSAAKTVTIAAAAPGIFVDANGNTVPYASGAAGQTLILFITGEGEVSPALPRGTAPSPSTTPVSQLPKPVLPVSMTIGGVPAPIVFYGIPYGLVGVTQINFTVPTGLTPGVQQLVVTVGTAASAPAKFTITVGQVPGLTAL